MSGLKNNVTIQDSSPLISYSDVTQWVDSSSSSLDIDDSTGYALNGDKQPTYHATNSNAAFWLPFNGSAIFVYGKTGPAGGPFNVTFVGDASSTPSPASLPSDASISAHTTNSPSPLFQQLLFARQDLLDTPHLLLVNTSGAEFELDYIVVTTAYVKQSGPLLRKGPVRTFTLDDASAAFAYGAGGWTTAYPNGGTPALAQAKRYGGTEHASTAAGAQVTLNFRGSGVSVHGTWGASSLIAQLDGGPPVTITSSYGAGNTTAPTRERELIYNIDGLGEGNHVLKMTNNGPANAGLNIDYATVYTTDPSNRDAVATSGSHSTSTAPVAGAIVGGVVGLLLIALGIFLWRRRQRRQRSGVLLDLLGEGPDGEGDPEAAAAQPFLSPVSQAWPQNAKEKGKRGEKPEEDEDEHGQAVDGGVSLQRGDKTKEEAPPRYDPGWETGGSE